MLAARKPCQAFLSAVKLKTSLAEISSIPSQDFRQSHLANPRCRVLVGSSGRSAARFHLGGTLLACSARLSSCPSLNPFPTHVLRTPQPSHSYTPSDDLGSVGTSALSVSDSTSQLSDSAQKLMASPCQTCSSLPKSREQSWSYLSRASLMLLCLSNGSQLAVTASCCQESRREEVQAGQARRKQTSPGPPARWPEGQRSDQALWHEAAGAKHQVLAEGRAAKSRAVWCCG